MKLKTFFLLGASLMILAGCGGEEEETKNGESGEGLGTLGSESEEESGNENNDTATEDSKKDEESTGEATHDSGLLDLNNTESGWVNFEGNLGGNSDYRTTAPVEYDSNQNYVLTEGGYVAYYNGEEYVKTVQQAADEPIEQVPETDNIRVSYHKSFSNVIALNQQ